MSEENFENVENVENVEDTENVEIENNVENVEHVEKKKKKEPVASYVTVRPLHFIADRRREYTVIVDQDDNAWLIPSDEVPGDFEFTVTLTELATLPKPYGFEAEIELALPTVQDVQRALWLKGIVTKDDLADYEAIKNALARVLPSANVFAQFRGE